MGKSYAIIKFNQKAEDDRVINKFQSPYNLNYTPYKNASFHENTLKMCAENSGNLASFSTTKLIILGDASVGKTSIVNRYCHKLFESNYKATIGVDFEVERFDILNVPYSIQIWDTAGQERFKSIAQSYYRGAEVILIVFDLSNIYSLHNCHKWLEEALNATGQNDPLIFLIGTKKDLLSHASYKSAERSAVTVAKKLSAEYWPLSSKTGENINKFFFRVVCLAFEKTISKVEYETEKVVIGEGLSFQKKEKKKENSCFGNSCSI